MSLKKTSNYHILLYFGWLFVTPLMGMSISLSPSPPYQSATSPVLTNPVAFSVHYGDERGYNGFTVGLNVNVSDPQGLSDISKVSVSGPGGFSAILQDPENDGSYYAWVSSSGVAPQTGTYVFRATDQEGNWIETSDVITRNLGIPTNIHPLYNEFIVTPTPTISWNVVPDASIYQVRIDDISGKSIWGSGSVTTTSVVFNFDLSATSGLTDGAMYYVNISAIDNEGNRGEQNSQFIYSSNTSNPVLNGPQIRSRNWQQADLFNNWGTDAWVYVADPQGLSDVDSVWVEGPQGYHLNLYDDGNHNDRLANDGYFANRTGGLLVKPVIGTYYFKVIDKSSNQAMKQDQLTAVLDYPHIFTPVINSKVSDPSFIMSWSAVEGAINYEVSVNSPDWSNRYWTSQRFAQTSVQYNVDHTGSSLTDGGLYIVCVRAYDNDGNESELYNWKFAYRIGNRMTVYVDSSNISGVENGTAAFPFNTIKEGINATIKNDTVHVAIGTYDGSIDDIGSINLIGEDPTRTVIKGFVAIRSTGSKISGFKITGSSWVGIEIHENATANISNNIITGNNGGGIGQGWGNASASVIMNNTIVGNNGPGISIASAGSTAIVTNNISAFNQRGLEKVTNTTVTNSYNCYFGNSQDLVNVFAGPGEIFSNPGFKDYNNGKYSLLTSSPCIDVGNPDPDSDGKTWVDDPADRDPDNTRSDMGALHLDQRTLTPDVPAGLTISSCNDLITLNWKKNKSLYFDHYSLFGGTLLDPTDEIAVINNISDTVKVLTGLKHGQTYFFRLKAVNMGGARSDFSSPVSEKVRTGVIPRIKTKWNDVLICYDLGDSIFYYQWFRDGNPVTDQTKQYYFTKTPGTYYVVSTDKNGCKNSSNLLTLSGSSLSVYPNPAKSSFVLRLDEEAEGEATVTISNSSGIGLVHFKGVISENRYIRDIPIGNLGNGIYYISVLMKDNKIYTGKIVVLK